MAVETGTSRRTVELGEVTFNERWERFEFIARSAEGQQQFGHYLREDAERHREQYAERLREQGLDVLVRAPAHAPRRAAGRQRSLAAR